MSRCTLSPQRPERRLVVRLRVRVNADPPTGRGHEFWELLSSGLEEDLAKGHLWMALRISAYPVGPSHQPQAETR